MDKREEDLVKLAAREAAREAVREAARAGAKEALQAAKREKTETDRQRKDNRFQNTKFLMTNYRDLKRHAAGAISELSQMGEEDYDFFEGLMSGRDRDLTIESITRSKARTAVILAHVNAMLGVYKKVCDNSPNYEDGRRFSVLFRMCIAKKPLSADNIAKADGTYHQAVYRDLNAACERLSVLLFGIPWFVQE